MIVKCPASITSQLYIWPAQSLRRRSGVYKCNLHLIYIGGRLHASFLKKSFQGPDKARSPLLSDLCRCIKRRSGPKHPRTNRAIVRSVPGCRTDKTGSVRNCGHAVRVLGGIQRAHLDATGKEGETKHKQSSHPPPPTHTHVNALSWKDTLLYYTACSHVGSVCASEHVLSNCLFAEWPVCSALLHCIQVDC